MTTERPYDKIIPLSKLLPLTSHPSTIRRLGVASALKNVSFTTSAHPSLLSPPLSILPYILLPLAAGADTYSESETEALPDDLQYLDESVKREADTRILKTHLETLLLLTSTREGRDVLREQGTYYVVRECHMAVEDEEVRDTCDRLVQVLMRDEEGEEKGVC